MHCREQLLEMNVNLYFEIKHDLIFSRFLANQVPYVKQFVLSKSTQYRKLKTEWRQNSYLAKSRIQVNEIYIFLFVFFVLSINSMILNFCLLQGLGLFAARDLEKHTMVIEYIGEVIRNEVANKREKLYEQQNRGIYMFRLDDDNVVDATMSGCLARYINHSCEVKHSENVNHFHILFFI